MSLSTHHKKSNKSRWFKDINVVRIGSIGLAVAALLVLGVFLHFVNVPETSTSAAPVSLNAASDKPADNSNTSNNKNVRGAVISGNSLVYKTDKPFSEREPIILTLFANDLDDDKLIYSVSNMPAGASFNPDTLTFSWTPLYNQAGSHIIRFEVSDGLASDYEDVTVNVVQYGTNWDVNVDSKSNILDIVLVGQHWNESGLTAWIKEDTNEDGVINVLDMIVVGQHWTG